ncbi:hypothetical protein GCM10027273_02840 [Nocardioides pakistanensis]
MNRGPVWQPMADLLSDVVWHAAWWLYGGMVAFGSCWWFGCGGYREWQQWERDWLERREQRRRSRIDRDIARGLREIEEFLRLRCSPPVNEPHGGTRPRVRRGHGRPRPLR